MAIYTCTECLSKDLDLPEELEFDSKVSCKSCGAHFTYGQLRSITETGQFEALPLSYVQEVSDTGD